MNIYQYNNLGIPRVAQKWKYPVCPQKITKNQEKWYDDEYEVGIPKRCTDFEIKNQNVEKSPYRYTVNYTITVLVNVYSVVNV